MIIYYIYLFVVCLIAFAMCYIDKKAAVKRKRRIPEKNLILISLAGGALGFFIGMLGFRHKTKHYKFTVSVPLMILLWTVITAALVYIKKAG